METDMLEFPHADIQSSPANGDPLGRFAQLEHERRELEDRLDAVKKEQAQLQEYILDDWANRGQKSANVDGLTIYVAQDFYCTKRSDVSTEQLIETLRQHGLERVIQVGYNASSLKAFIKEQIADGSAIPEPLQRMLHYDTIPRLRARLA